jgi:H+/gluconate symporter-like permease
MRNVLLSAFLALVGGLVVTVFGAMMMVPEPTAVANLKTFGLAARTGLFLGLGVAVVGVILVVMSLRQRKSSGHAIVEAGQIIGSAIEDNYSERSGSAARANVIRDSSVRRNILKKPNEKKGK